MTVELVVLVGIVLLAFVDTLAIAAWREVRVAQATRPTDMRALFVFGSGSAEDHVHVGSRRGEESLPGSDAGPLVTPPNRPRHAA